MVNYLKKENEKITDQDILEREKVNKVIVRFVSITITLAMILYTAHVCLQKNNYYHGTIDNPKKVEESIENKHTK